LTNCDALCAGEPRRGYCALDGLTLHGTREPGLERGRVFAQQGTKLGDDRKPATDHDRIVKLEQQLHEMQKTMNTMQRVGGFADSKTLSMRSTRIEERLERLEFDGKMVQDFTGLATDWMARHLHERHAIAETDNAPDSIFVRKIRRRLAEWADKVGLMSKRRDVSDARRDENRLRPSQVAGS